MLALACNRSARRVDAADPALRGRRHQQLPKDDEADARRAAPVDDCLRHQCLGGVELALQAIEHDLIFGRVFGVAAVLRVTRAAREIGALGMCAGQRAIGNGVAVLVEVAVELVDLLELFLGQHLAAVGHVGVVPFQVRTHPVVHADVEIRHDEHRRLQALGEIERAAPPCRNILPGCWGTAGRDAYRRAKHRRRASGRTAECASACPSMGRRAECRRSPRALRRSRPGR